MQRGLLASENRITWVLLTILFLAPIGLHAQDFKLFDRSVQVHGFASVGLAYTNDNNWLTMDTTSGSGFTEMGLNMSTAVTDKFRVGAQVYDRNVGNLGNWQPTLDWAFGSYRFKSWLGLRAGKVKTVLGLMNDTQDMEFLHTWALLPQSVYPTDLRSTMIAHVGADLFGEIPIHKQGNVAYTIYYGARPTDFTDGHYYNLLDGGNKLKSESTTVYGADFRWSPKISGLLLGVSWAAAEETDKGTQLSLNAPFLTFFEQHYNAYYSDYTRGKLHLEAEYRKHTYPFQYHIFGTTDDGRLDDHSWYGTAAYRVNKKFEVGGYYSHFQADQDTVPGSPGADNHEYDKVMTFRFDINRFWNVKLEGHFIDGHADTYSARGFYQDDNLNGLQPTTSALVVRTGFNF